LHKTLQWHRDQHNTGHLSNPDNSFLWAYAGDPNTIWLGTWGSGLKKFDYTGKKFTEYKWQPGKDKGTVNIVTSLCRFSTTQLLIGSENGLMVFDIPGKDISVAYQCYTDQEGIVWAITDAGLLKLNPRENLFRWVPIAHENASSGAGMVVDIAHWPGDSLYYMGSMYGQEFFEYHAGRGTTTRYAIKRSDDEENEVNDLEFESQNRLWIASTKGLYIFDRAGKKISRSPLHQLPAFKEVNDVVALAKDSGGIWWIATGGHGIFKYTSGTGHLHHYTTRAAPEMKLTTDRTYTLFIDSRHNVWFGNSDQQSIGCILPAQNRVVYYNSSQGFPAGNCRSICESKEGNIFYVLRGTGLCVLDHPLTARATVTVYNSANGLPTDRVLSVFRDSQDRCWMSTSDGIVLCNSATMQFRRFNTYDGLKSNITFSNFYENEKGQLFIGYPEGFHFFDPATLLQTKDRPEKIILHTFTAGGKEQLAAISQNGRLTIDYNENPLYFEFAALTYTDNPFIRYAYKLEGVDKDWIYAGTRRFGAYSNLPGGNYRLRIKAADRSGIWNEQNFALAIQVRPPFWATWWFRLAALAAAAGIIYWLVRRRIMAIRTEEERKTFIRTAKAEAEMKALRAQMNPHFIFNCMNTIDAYMHKNNTPEASRFLHQFSKLIRAILENSQHPFITITKEVEALQLYMELERRRHENSFIHIVELSPGIEKNGYKIPPLLIQPYVENAIQHGLRHKVNGQGMLLVRFEERENDLLCTIDDNGIGRTASAALNRYRRQAHHSMGLTVTAERIDIMNDIMNVSSGVEIVDKTNGEGGTTVRLTLPKIN
jgi:streptogramin lyase